MVVETQKSLAARTRGARGLEVRVGRQGGGATLDLFVAIEGKHGPLWFELDRGNLAPVLIAPHAFLELGIAPPPSEHTASVELPIQGLGAVKCDVAAKEWIYDGLLNAQFFRRYALTTDLAASRAWAAPNE
jgi:hypothetical protein